MVTTINTVDAKDQFSALINQVEQHKERIILTRRGRHIAVLVPIEDFLLLQASQDKMDLQEAADALKQIRKQGAAQVDHIMKELRSCVISTPYDMKVSPVAKQHFYALSEKDQQSIIRMLKTLVVNPHLLGVKKIEGMTGLYQEATERARLIYKIEDNEILLLLIKQ